jgi:hypothetical protein
MHKATTGFEERNPNALWHQRLSLLGPPCERCGKPLRTPVAKHCVECGAVRSNKTIEPTRWNECAFHQDHRAARIIVGVGLMREKTKTSLSVALWLAVSAGLFWALCVAVRALWRELVSVNADLAVGVLMAAATVLAATVTVMLGRYFERKRDIEAHFRSEKIKIYDEFLSEMFKVFHAGAEANTDNLTQFLREWQRKLILWGGNDVLRAYFKWMGKLKAGNPDAQTVFLMDEFFRALRVDIGQRSDRLPRGAFAHLVLRRADFFLQQAAINPDITLEEISKLEKERFGDDT